MSELDRTRAELVSIMQLTHRLENGSAELEHLRQIRQIEADACQEGIVALRHLRKKVGSVQWSRLDLKQGALPDESFWAERFKREVLKPEKSIEEQGAEHFLASLRAARR